MYIFFSFLVLATLGSLGFLPAYGISIFPISYLAGTIAVVILSYAIFKHHLFNIRIIAAELFTYTISLTLFVRAFFAETTQSKIVGFIIFLFVSFFGVLLMRSVSKEVEARKEIEKLAFDLEKANERLKELDQLKSEFLSLASHQIRAPLTSIKGYASMIIEGDYGYMSEHVRQAVDVIYKSCQNLVLIVSEFLDISRIEQGRMKYDMSDFDLRKMTAEVLTELTPIIEKAGLSAELKADENADYSVYGDQGKMKQIMTNMVDNAVKYSKTGTITVTLSSDPSSIKASVRDNGIGIAPEDIPKLFGKFIRAHDAFKTNVIGTGLGLYVARQMITAQGGKIWVESDGLGKGSTFYVEIPKSQNKANQN
jgi:signal transduction histidine kinase